jgi:hypothetical protein
MQIRIRRDLAIVTSNKDKVRRVKLIDNIFFSIGAMKAGTSWLYEALRLNPDINAVPIKEVHYLWHRFGTFQLLSREQRIATTELHVGRLLRQCDPEKTNEVLSWFGRYMADPVDDLWFSSLFGSRERSRYCAEFSNMNALLGPEAWEHIRKIAGTLRILYTIRNPAERMWSHSRFQAQIVGCFDNLNAWSTHEVVAFLEQHGILAHGGYSRVIARLQRYFDPGEFMVCTFDDVRASPTSALRHIERFLGISQHDYAGTNLSLIHNPSQKMDIPPAFERAMRPYINAEMAALVDRGINLPAAWSH